MVILDFLWLNFCSFSKVEWLYSRHLQLLYKEKLGAAVWFNFGFFSTQSQTYRDTPSNLLVSGAEGSMVSFNLTTPRVLLDDNLTKAGSFSLPA